MSDIVAQIDLPTPVRVIIADDTAALLEFAYACHSQGSVAIATLVEIRGTAARALGSQVVIAADGRYAGYVSGGCVESAIAFEALLAIKDGKNRIVKLGEGSPFIDIVLPCGGGISVAIHVLRDPVEINRILNRLKQRKMSSLKLSIEQMQLVATSTSRGTGWIGNDFFIAYRPSTRLLISGQSVEATSVAALAQSCHYDVEFVDFRDTAETICHLIDPFTAVILLHHDLDQERPVLQAALNAKPFYIGALGSASTHRRRIEAMRHAGFSQDKLARIKAPIGLFGRTRDSTSLALSVLADIAVAHEKHEASA